MKELAIYGKGGIGKSTLCANLSAALATPDNRILQIGCDPKHDSTRLLLHGKRLTTVLDYIRVTGPLDYRLEDVLSYGYKDVGCIEAGGPKPGIGCAGRGIITAFEMLDKFHIKDSFDMILYDVLGDVVCGGFAVPIRREYADEIFLVTSGEFMAIYAANNILKGIRNFDKDTRRRVAGILYNSRNVQGEDERVALFASAVGLPVVAKIPRSNVFAEAEHRNVTAYELAGRNDAGAGEAAGIRALFEDLAERVKNGLPLYEARPLDDEQLEKLFSDFGAGEIPDAGNGPKQKDPEAEDLKSNAASKANSLTYDAGYLSKNMIRNEPLHGCAFNGAANMAVHIRDAAVLCHGPKSCAYLSYQSISSPGRRHLFERGTILPVSILPNMLSTEMSESDMVFGGMEKLTEKVEGLIRSKDAPRAVVVVSTCPAGIIGDDIGQLKSLSTKELPIVTLKTDGNLSGDYMQGMIFAYTELAKQIIDPDVPEEPDKVNIVFEKVVVRQTDDNFRVIEEYLSRMGVSVGCRFLCNTTYDAVENFCSASLNLLAYNDYTGNLLQEFFETTYGSRFFDRPFPVGFAQTEAWLKGLSAYFGREAQAEELVGEKRSEYEERMARIRPFLEGKTLMIFTFNHDLDWIISAARDAGVAVKMIAIVNYSQDEGFRSELTALAGDDIEIELNYDRSRRQEDIERIRPDILLSNYASDVDYDDCIRDTIPMCPDVGFFSGLLMAERWCGLIRNREEGSWQDDRRLFERYYPR